MRKTATDIRHFKDSPTPMVCLTSYTAPMTRIADDYADLLLVGDSVGMVLYDFPTTLPVTMEMMLLHGRAVVRSSKKAFVVVDMPFGSYQADKAEAFKNAALIMAETGCGAVKLEGGLEMAETVRFLTARGVPVIGHIGLQPQSVNQVGGYRVAGRQPQDAQRLRDEACALEEAGALAVVVECTEESVAQDITRHVGVPTIGIGGSVHCDGQILVTEDMLGLTGGPLPKFVKAYGDVGGAVHDALASYAEEVRNRKFPDEDYIYRSLKMAARSKA